MKISKIISVAIIMASAVLPSSPVFAQAPSGGLHGQVTDQSGAVVTQADVALTPDELREIDDALSDITVQGERYPAFLQAMVDR